MTEDKRVDRILDGLEHIVKQERSLKETRGAIYNRPLEARVGDTGDYHDFPEERGAAHPAIHVHSDREWVATIRSTAKTGKVRIYVPKGTTIVYQEPY